MAVEHSNEIIQSFFDRFADILSGKHTFSSTICPLRYDAKLRVQSNDDRMFTNMKLHDLCSRILYTIHYCVGCEKSKNFAQTLDVDEFLGNMCGFPKGLIKASMKEISASKVGSRFLDYMHMLN
ncbi:hypothetical protein AHF37_02793 [Paragonimus kellicotti]|nr:hypothetical protein AHF37_02793 [Paragonimus kellicotti]